MFKIIYEKIYTIDIFHYMHNVIIDLTSFRSFSSFSLNELCVGFTQFWGWVFENSAASYAPSVFHSTKSPHPSWNRQMPSSLPISRTGPQRPHIRKAVGVGGVRGFEFFFFCTHNLLQEIHNMWTIALVEPKTCSSFSDWCRRYRSISACMSW